MDATWKEIRPFVYGEMAFIAVTVLFAAIQFWPGFAFMALLCVLTPLWVGATAALVIAAKILDES